MEVSETQAKLGKLHRKVLGLIPQLTPDNFFGEGVRDVIEILWSYPWVRENSFLFIPVIFPRIPLASPTPPAHGGQEKGERKREGKGRD